MQKLGIAVIGLGLALVLLAAGAGFCQTTTASPLGNSDPDRSETAIGDLTTDSMRAAMRTDIAFIAASDLKMQSAPFPAGKVSPADVEALIAYRDDPLSVLSLTGAAIRRALERSVGIYPQRHLAFLQVSGLSFTFDPAKKRHERIASIKVGNAPIQDDKTYTVAMLNSLANGAIGYWKIWSKENVTLRSPNVTLAKALETFLQTHREIDYSTLDRIVVAK